MVRDDPEVAGPAVEELLRWVSIINSGFPRTTTTEVEIGGHVIPEGERVLAAIPAANRDPHFIADPSRLDITRGAIGHLAFGHGPHYCIGAPRARMEMQIAIPALLRRFPNLAPAEPDSRDDFRVYNSIFGLHSLPVIW